MNLLLLALVVAPCACLVAPRAASRPSSSRAAAFSVADEEALFAASTFPIKPDALIARAKEILAAGIGTKDGGRAAHASK